MRVRHLLETLDRADSEKIMQALNRYSMFLRVARPSYVPEPLVITSALKSLFPGVNVLPDDEVIQFVRVRKSGLVYWRIRKITHPEPVIATFEQKLWVKRKLTAMM